MMAPLNSLASEATPVPPVCQATNHQESQLYCWATEKPLHEEEEKLEYNMVTSIPALYSHHSCCQHRLAFSCRNSCLHVPNFRGHHAHSYRPSTEAARARGTSKSAPWATSACRADANFRAPDKLMKGRHWNSFQGERACLCKPLCCSLTSWALG